MLLLSVNQCQAPLAQSHDNSAMITLFVYPLNEDWGQFELIDATLKGEQPSATKKKKKNVLLSCRTVWFGNAAGNVATIDIAEVKSVDEIRQKIYEVRRSFGSTTQFHSLIVTYCRLYLNVITL